MSDKLILPMKYCVVVISLGAEFQEVFTGFRYSVTVQFKVQRS